MEQEIFELARQLQREQPSGWAQRVRNLPGDHLFLSAAPETAIPLGYISHVISGGDPGRGITRRDDAYERRALARLRESGYRRVAIGDPDFPVAFSRYLKSYDDLSAFSGPGNPSSRHNLRAKYVFWILDLDRTPTGQSLTDANRPNFDFVASTPARSVQDADDDLEFLIIASSANAEAEAEAEAEADEGQGPGDFQEQITKSLKDSQAARLSRLTLATGIAEKVETTVISWKRNPDVVAAALIRANGVCEGCRKEAPFLRRSNKMPFLEVHHVIPTAHALDSFGIPMACAF